jgi:hypothetical protein
MTRIIRIAFAAAAALAAVALLAAGASARTVKNTAAGRQTAVQHIKNGPSSRGPQESPGQASASRTPLGLPPESGRVHPRDSVIVDQKPPPASHEDESEISGVSNPSSTALLGYYNGPVQTTPRVYLVFWGASWTTTSGDPDGVASRLHYLYQGLGGSSWANVLKQYGSNYGSFSNPTSQYGGWMRDTSVVPAHPTRSEIEAVARRAAAKTSDYSYNAQYVVAMPWGVVDQTSLNSRACAWHNWMYASGSSWVTFTSLPYTPYMDQHVFGCGGGKVNGSNGMLDGVTINAGHEYAESVNDPGMNGYKDAEGWENADKCSWVNLGNRTLANGYTFPMQPTWSNLWATQYKYGCYFS